METKTEQNGSPERRSTLQNAVFGAILIILFILVCRLFAPFFTMILWSVLFYILFSPLHSRVTSRFDRRKLKGKVLLNVWAAVFSLATVIIILLPLSFVAVQFFRQLVELIHLAVNFLNSQDGKDLAGSFLEDISTRLKDISAGQLVLTSAEIQSRILVFLSSGLQTLIQFSRSFVLNVGSFLSGLLFMIFSLFFFYMDGPYLLSFVTKGIPIRGEYTRALVGKFKEITRNLIFGYIITALIQALMAFVIFTIFRIKGALVLTGLTFICVFIPIVGGSLVWAPIGIIKMLGGNISGGIVFLVTAGIFISALDNVIRPFFLKNQIQLHPLIIFFAILGGLSVFGFNGIILGPIVVILFITVLDLFFRENEPARNGTKNSQD